MANPDSPMTEYASGALCVAYIDGFTDGLNLERDTVCVVGASLGTLSRVYISYMEKNPRLLDEHKVVGLRRALLDIYPCSKSGAGEKRR